MHADVVEGWYLETCQYYLSWVTGLANVAMVEQYGIMAANQTGNIVGVFGIASGRWVLAGYAVLAFVAGVIVMAHAGRCFGGKEVRRKSWVVTTALIQVALFGGSTALMFRGSCTGVQVVLMNFEGGAQNAMARKLVGEITTSPLTGALVDLCVSPNLFWKPWNDRALRRRIVFVACVAIGCLLGGWLNLRHGPRVNKWILLTTVLLRLSYTGIILLAPIEDQAYEEAKAEDKTEQETV